MMMPPVASPRSTTQAPSPSISDCSAMRKTREKVASEPGASMARTVSARWLSLASAQRRPSAGASPSARTTSALRRARSSSARRRLALAASASAGPRARCSASKAVATMMAAPASASRPSQGCRAKISNRKTGSQGASKMATRPGPVATARTWSRSRTACGPCDGLPRSGALSTMSKTRSRRRRSMRPPSRTSTRLRITSSRPYKPYSPSINSVSASSVEPEWAPSTRS